MFLKQATEITVKIGPFLDDADAVTPEAALVLSQADVRLSKNGGDFAQKNNADACVYDENGWYNCTLDITDTGTLGRLQLSVLEAGALMVWHEYIVVEPETYDLLYGTGLLEGTLSLPEALRIMFAALAGKLTGGGTGELTMRDSTDSVDRIVAVISSAKDRTSVTLDGSV